MGRQADINKQSDMKLIGQSKTLFINMNTSLCKADTVQWFFLYP